MKRITVFEIIICVTVYLLIVIGYNMWKTDPPTPRSLPALAYPLGMVFLIQCNRPFAFFGFDTSGRMYWVDATRMDMRHLMMLKQTVDPNHYLEKELPCIGHSTAVPPTDF